MLGILSLSLITATAAKALRTPGLPPHIRTAALVLGAAGWMQVREWSFFLSVVNDLMILKLHILVKYRIKSTQNLKQAPTQANLFNIQNTF